MLESVVPLPAPVVYVPPGCATHGFMAYDISRQQVVFLKDSWRVDLPDINPEGLVYDVLNRANVKHVPNCLASGDISSPTYHAMKSHDYASKSWACPLETSLMHHRHYRLILDIVRTCLID